MSAPTVEVLGVRHRFGSTTALDGIDLTLGPGITGLFGPNGAGKTTLLRHIATTLAPTEGRLRLLGHDPATTAGRLHVRRRLPRRPEPCLERQRRRPLRRRC